MQISHSLKMVAAGLGVIALALFIADSSISAGDKKEPRMPKDVVKATASAGKIDDAGKQTVTVTITVEKGWYIYANPVKNEEFDGNKTIITVTAQKNLASVNVMYPAGKAHEEKGIGSYSIHEEKVTIPVIVQRAKGDSSPLSVDVGYNVCSFKGQCFRRDSYVLTLP